jgi:hypothetical protein
MFPFVFDFLKINISNRNAVLLKQQKKLQHFCRLISRWDMPKGYLKAFGQCLKATGKLPGNAQVKLIPTG